MHPAPEEQRPQDKDRHLDIPSEANRDKHINFLDAEDKGDTNTGNRDKADEARQRQWQEGIEAGKKAHNDEG